MSSRRPRMGNPEDIKGGVIHLLTELGALIGLLSIMAVLAWMMLLF